MHKPFPPFASGDLMAPVLGSTTWVEASANGFPNLNLHCYLQVPFFSFDWVGVKTCIYVYRPQRDSNQWSSDYCTLDAVSNAPTNENYSLTYQISSYINLNMIFQNATGHITTSEITVIYSIYLSLKCKLIK